MAHGKPLSVELWIKGLPLSGRSKGHIREVMHMVFDWAMRWELIPHDRNPMSLVRVKGCSKRTRLPKVLTIEEFNRLLEKLREPYRTMALVALFLGPRVSEIAGLKWNDVDWDRSTISIARSWVIGEVADTKTEGSAKPLPMDSDLAIVLKEHRQRTKDYDSPWMFVNPATGNPFWPSKIRENHLVPAGIAAGIGRVGWHTFRHTYSSLLREHEVDIKVQQALFASRGHPNHDEHLHASGPESSTRSKSQSCEKYFREARRHRGGSKGSGGYQVLPNQYGLCLVTP